MTIVILSIWFRL